MSALQLEWETLEAEGWDADHFADRPWFDCDLDLSALVHLNGGIGRLHFRGRDCPDMVALSGIPYGLTRVEARLSGGELADTEYRSAIVSVGENVTFDFAHPAKEVSAIIDVARRDLMSRFHTIHVDILEDSAASPLEVAIDGGGFSVVSLVASRTYVLRVIDLAHQVTLRSYRFLVDQRGDVKSAAPDLRVSGPIGRQVVTCELGEWRLLTPVQLREIGHLCDSFNVRLRGCFLPCYVESLKSASVTWLVELEKVLESGASVSVLAPSDALVVGVSASYGVDALCRPISDWFD